MQGASTSASRSANSTPSLRAPSGPTGPKSEATPASRSTLQSPSARRASSDSRSNSRRLDCLKGPEVAVGVELVRVADGRWRITVENPGPVLSAQVFEKLNARAEGLACEVLDGEADREISEGLGLGLTICRGIADSHGATLRFEARPEGGVRATVEIDAAGPAGEDTEGRKTMKVNEQGEDA